MSDLQLRLKYSQSDADDWTKTEDKALRKTIQNRLAQRKRRTKNAKGKVSKRQRSLPEHQDELQDEQAPALSEDTSSCVTYSSPEQNETKNYRLRFILYIQGVLASPTLSEHRFLCLTQYSFLRAFVQNTHILSLDPIQMVEDDYLSPWTTLNPYPSSALSPSSSFPRALTPTQVQLNTFHHPFMDVLASPSFRDNILVAGLSDEQEEQLCYDLHDGVSFYVWGSQSWNPMAWEVTPRFADKWSWLLDDETINYSNFWRAERGEGPLDVSKRVSGHIEDIS